MLISATAHAHIGLIDPPSREGASVLKTGPCGRAGSTRSTHITTYHAGDTITVRFDEYIDHPGHFRVALDLHGDDGFADPPCIAHCDDRTDPIPPQFDFDTTPTDMIVLADHITDTRGGESTITVTLPGIACDDCTLQVIQMMYDKSCLQEPSAS